MTIATIDESQRKAATVVGFSYLVALPPAIFAEVYVRTQLIAFDNAAQTARNIMAHERLGACAFSFIIFPELAKVVPVEIYGSYLLLRTDNGLLAPANGITTFRSCARIVILRSEAARLLNDCAAVSAPPTRLEALPLAP